MRIKETKKGEGIKICIKDAIRHIIRVGIEVYIAYLSDPR
jgi:hypothetical protein